MFWDFHQIISQRKFNCRDRLDGSIRRMVLSIYRKSQNERLVRDIMAVKSPLVMYDGILRTIKSSEEKTKEYEDSIAVSIAESEANG
jgi:hypothetical protein